MGDRIISCIIPRAFKLAAVFLSPVAPYRQIYFPNTITKSKIRLLFEKSKLKLVLYFYYILIFLDVIIHMSRTDWIQGLHDLKVENNLKSFCGPHSIGV